MGSEIRCSYIGSAGNIGRAIVDRDRWLVAVAHNTIKVPLERSLPHCSGCSRSAYGPLPARTPQIRSHSLIWTVLVLTIRVSSTDTDYAAARIGVFRQCFSTPTTDPELRAVTERALGLSKQGEAVVVAPFAIPGYTELEKNLWCGDFQADLNAYLTRHPNAPSRDLPAIVASGLICHTIGDEIRAAVAPPKGHDRRAPYPTSSNPSAWLGTQPVPRRQQPNPLAPETDFPAITLPVGFTHGMLPAGLTFLGPTFSESTFIRYAYDFEQPTRGAKTPRTFAGLP